MRTRIKRTHGVSDRPFSSPRLHHPEEGRVGEAGRPDRKVTSPAMWILSAILALLSPRRSHLLYIFWLRELSLKWKSTKSSIFFFPRSIWVAKCSLVFLQRAYQRSSVNHTVRSASVDEVRVSVATALSFVFPSHGGCHCSCQLPTPPLFPLTPSKPETQGVSDFSQESKVQELRRGGECFQEVFRKYSSQVNQMLQSFNWKYRCYTYNQYLTLMCHKASFFFFFFTPSLSFKSHSEQMLSRSLPRRAHCVASKVQPARPRSKFRAKRLGRKDISPLNCIFMCQTLSLHCHEFQQEKVLIHILQREQSPHTDDSVINNITRKMKKCLWKLLRVGKLYAFLHNIHSRYWLHLIYRYV